MNYTPSVHIRDAFEIDFLCLRIHLGCCSLIAFIQAVMLTVLSEKMQNDDVFLTGLSLAKTER